MDVHTRSGFLKYVAGACDQIVITRRACKGVGIMAGKMVKIISLEDMKEHVSAWVEHKGQYVKYSVLPSGKVRVMESYSMDEYISYDHFVGVMSKFCPFTWFFVEPVFLPLRYDDLKAEAEKRRQSYNQNQQEG